MKIITISIGSRILHIPREIPYLVIQNNSEGKSVQISFHIDKSGAISFGAADPARPLLWDYMLELELNNAPGRIDDSSFFEQAKKGRINTDKKQSGFSVYTNGFDDLFIKETSKPPVGFVCFENMKGYSGPQSPFCASYERPWENASLRLTFGRRFVANFNQISSCVHALVDAFSR